MKAKSILTVLILFALALTLTTSSGLAQGRPPSGEGSVMIPPELPVGSAFTYQGQLKKDGRPYNGLCDFVFRLYDTAEGGTLIAAVYKDNVEVSNGLFTVQLDFGEVFWAPDSFATWLEVGVRCPAGDGQYTDLAPRQKLTPVPYALALPGLRTQQNLLSPNIIGGYNGNQVIEGVIGATISGGGRWQLTSHPNRVTDNFGTIGGGEDNRAGNNNDVINDAEYATVGGGANNIANGGYAAIGGGYYNTASGVYATVGGGYYNTANGDPSATVSGGADNTASGAYAAIGGGYYNTASGVYATVSGGYYNMADGDTGATVGGGVSNAASGIYATVSGGTGNTVNGDTCATVGGGFNNTASGNFATVPGGHSAVASHYGEMAYASGHFAAHGDAQTSLYVMRIEQTCTAGVWYDLYLNGSGGNSGYLSVAPGRALAFDALIVGRTQAGESAGYLIRGVIENVGGTTAFVGSPSVTTLGEDDAVWNVQAVASNTYDALFIQVQGNGETIRWVATVRTAEVSW